MAVVPERLDCRGDNQSQSSSGDRQLRFGDHRITARIEAGGPDRERHVEWPKRAVGKVQAKGSRVRRLDRGGLRHDSVNVSWANQLHADRSRELPTAGYTHMNDRRFTGLSE